MIAKSRIPTAVDLLQLSSRDWIVSADSVGGMPVFCQPATGGTAVASAAGIRPVTNKYRNSDRCSATWPFAAPTLHRLLSASRNALTSVALRSWTSTPPVR